MSGGGSFAEIVEHRKHCETRDDRSSGEDTPVPPTYRLLLESFKHFSIRLPYSL